LILPVHTRVILDEPGATDGRPGGREADPPSVHIWVQPLTGQCANESGLTSGISGAEHQGRARQRLPGLQSGRVVGLVVVPAAPKSAEPPA
jgi:hypothetical protein